MTANLIRFAYEPLDDVVRFPRNPKAHALEELGDSMDRWGYTEAILVDEGTGMLVAGHGRLDALVQKRAAGEVPPEGIDVDRGGRWLVPVTRKRFASADEAAAYVVASNQLAIRGGWDPQALHDLASDLLARGVPFTGTGFDPEALMAEARAAMGKPPDEEKEAPTQEDLDERFEPPAKPVTRSGDLWILGAHRLLCGDSTRDGDVDRLLDGARPAMVLTDPPFAIYGSSTGIGADIADDKMVRPFFERVFAQAHRVLPWFGHVYVHTDWRSWAAMWEAARTSGVAAKNCIVWDKGGQGLGSMYAQCHELIFFGAKTPPPAAMAGNKARGERVVHRPNLVRHNRVQGAERIHNAAKPVALLRELIVNSSEPAAGVLDLFCGGGSTLIACEAEGRACYTMDIEPKWCDAAVRRWEKLTGQAATRVPVGEEAPRRRKRRAS